MSKKSDLHLLANIYKNPRWSGKRIILIGGEIHATSSRTGAGKLLKRLVKKHPHQTPKIVYVPKAETLILISDLCAKQRI